MSTQDIPLVDELIVNASTLPIECQDWLLSIAKGMAFTKNHLSKKSEKVKKEKEQKEIS